MKTKHIKVEYKSTQLISILGHHFGKKMNFARISFIGIFICALCKVQTVCFERIACGFEAACQTSSSLRRIQRFIADYQLDKNLGGVSNQLICGLRVLKHSALQFCISQFETPPFRFHYNRLLINCKDTKNQGLFQIKKRLFC